jgi:hypothetical protein
MENEKNICVFMGLKCTHRNDNAQNQGTQAENFCMHTLTHLKPNLN